MEGGGAERAMANLLRYLLPKLSGDRVELVLLDNLKLHQTLPEDLSVVTLDGQGRMGRSAAQLYRHWASSNGPPDVCVSFLARANVLNTQLKRRFGHRAIISERVNASSHFAASRAAPLLRWIARRTYPRADHVVAVSGGVADDLVECFDVSPARLSVIGNPIDAKRLQALAGAEPSIDLPSAYLLGVGRLVPNKNFALILDALAATPEAPDLVLLGQGPEEGALREQAARLGISDRVTFGGYVDNPYPIIKGARALISASRAEGFPNTLIEALALGCPVVATDCPSGPAEVLESEPKREPPWPETSHGLLVPMDDHGAMVAAISAICNDAVRQDYAARAQKRALYYGHEAVVSAYLELLSK